MIIQFFFKFHDFSMPGTFFSDFSRFSMISRACGNPVSCADCLLAALELTYKFVKCCQCLVTVCDHVILHHSIFNDF